MVTVSQQAGIPIMKADSATLSGKERTVGTDSFLSFLDKSLSKPLQALKGSVKAGENTVKPLQSNRRAVQEDGNNTRTVPTEGSSVTQSEQTKEIQPETQSEALVNEANGGMKPETKAVDDAAEDKEEENQGQNPDESESLSSAIELTQQSDQLLAIMDEIIQVLQQAASPSKAPTENSDATMGISSEPAGKAVTDELQEMLSNLVKTAEQLEGTKTAGHALAFAKKLQQLLGNESFEALIRDELEVSVSSETNTGGLIGKMLREAENTKMHLVQTSLQEITIPAMKAEAPKAAAVAEIADEGEETTVQDLKPEEKAFIPENSENASSEPAEDETWGNQHLAKAQGKETENAADMNRNSLADAAPNLNEPQKETIIAGPARTQTFSKADVTRQIIEKAETIFREDKSEMVLQLKPESLGKISLKVIHERGEIIARFVAENEQVKAILEGNMQLLKDSLQKSGVMVQSLEVSVGQQGGDHHRNWDNRNNEAASPAEPKASAIQQRVLRQPAYGYGGSAADYYSNESSEIDLTA